MAPTVCQWFKSKFKGNRKQDGAATPFRVQVPSQHIVETLVPTRNESHKQIAPSTTNPAPPVQPAITVFTAPPPLPPAPDLPAPTTSKLQPAPSDSTASGLQGRLWNEAYDDLRKEEPKLVDAYEILLSRELRESDSNLIDETSQKNEIEQTNSKTRRSQMVRLVRAGLEKTEKEATVKNNIQGITDIVSPIKGLVSAAVNSVPEAAIAWTGACFALQILANPINETVANRDGITYVISRMEWYWNLSSLLLEDNQVDNTAALRAELEKHIIDLYKQLFLYQMKSVCSYYRNRLVAALRDMVKLDDWEGALQSIKTAENAIQQDSDQYNTQEFKSYLRKLVGAAESLAADILPGIRQVLREIRQEDQDMEQDEKHDEKNKKCLADLLNTDPRDDKERIKQTKGGLLADSSNWILKHKRFRQWHDEDEARVLWIKGDPGKGKTMLMIAIVDELERQLKQSKQPNQQPTTILSYFFCQGTNSNLNNATAVLKGLIYLLADQNPSLISHLRKRYDTAGSKLFEGVNVFFSLSSVLGDMLREASLSRAYILIDALDECETELPQLLTFIAANSSVSPRVKWLVSSRNKIEIEQHLKLNGSAMNLSLELTQNAEQVSHAVNAYIDSKILEVDSLRNDPGARDQIRDIMHKRANGTFLWVALVIKELKDPETVNALYTVSQVPTDLYQLYDRMITQIQQLRDPDSCWSVLSTATLANRPLHLAELSVLSRLPKIVSPSIEKVRKIVAMCGSFLTVQNDYVYHIHQSAKDYLSDKASNTIFPSGPREVHQAIFLQSLQAMLTLRRDIYDLRHPGTLVSDIKAPDPDPLAAIRYSCVHWISHFCDSYGSRYPEVKAVGDFLERKFLYWLEAMGLVQHMGDAILSITRLETLLREKSADLNLIDLVYDSRRFILQNRWVIENYPLQAYMSALIYSPVNCLIRTIFKHEEPEWVQPKPVLESNWSPCLQTLEGHRGPVISIAFSPSSKLLASGSGDNTIKIWDITTGSLQQTLEDHHGHVYSVAFSPDSKLLASGSGDDTIKIWDITTGSLQQTFEDHHGSSCSVAFSPDSKLWASVSRDNTIKIWDITTGSLQKMLKSYNNFVLSVVFSPDSKLLASVSSDDTIKTWDITTGSLRQTLKGHNELAKPVIFSSDSKLLASGSFDKTIKIWDIGMPSYQTSKDHINTDKSVIFSCDSKMLRPRSRDGAIETWETAAGPQKTLDGHQGKISSLAFSHDSTLLATGSQFSPIIGIWDTATGNVQQTLELHGRSWISSLAFSRDSTLLATGSQSSSTIGIWDTATGNLQQTLEFYDNSETSPLVFSHDSTLLAAGSPIGSIVKIWDTATGSLQQTLISRDPLGTSSLAFSHDATLLAVGSQIFHNIEIWDMATGNVQQTLEFHGRSTVSSLAFSHDSTLLAASSRISSTIGVWDTATRKLQQILRVQTGLGTMSFERTDLCLNTELGRIDLAAWLKDTRSPLPDPYEGQIQEIQYQGYGLRPDWITWNGRGVLWLPTDYRPRSMVMSSIASPSTPSTVTKIAFITAHGSVVLFRLPSSGPL